MAQFKNHGFNKGKIVYWVDYQRFENSKDKNDGREKAEAYCLDNFINTNNIQKFDSRTECDRWEYLLEQQRQGIIDNLDHHFTLKIQDEFVNANNELIPAITYEADFIYRIVETSQRIVEDVKGSEYFIDERYITLKQVFDKLMYNKGLFIRTVLYRDKNWVDWHIGDKKKSQKLIKKQREELKQLKQEKHDHEIAENKKARELERLAELKWMVANNIKMTKPQRLRLAELKEKYE